MKTSQSIKFNPGLICRTPGVLEKVHTGDLAKGLSRHLCGDWGEVCDEDRQENELGLAQGFRLMSAYTSRDGIRFWIITEADRSATTALLPDEY